MQPQIIPKQDKQATKITLNHERLKCSFKDNAPENAPASQHSKPCNTKHPSLDCKASQRPCPGKSDKYKSSRKMHRQAL